MACCLAWLGRGEPCWGAERASTLFAGPELRVRPGRQDGVTTYELGVPHGISSASGNTSFVARLGMVMPVEGAGVLAFPVSMGARFEPLATFLRPVAGVEAGGYLLIPRDGRMAPREEAGPPWYWSMRALVGTRVSVSRAVALTLYVDAAWIQQPRDELARLQVYSGVGAGAEVSVSFVPGLRYVDMFLNGRNAPEGF